MSLTISTEDGSVFTDWKKTKNYFFSSKVIINCICGETYKTELHNLEGNIDCKKCGHTLKYKSI